MKHGNNHEPRLIFWELTKRCNLRCAHCRAEAYEDAREELETEIILSVIDDIAQRYRPILVLTGGEPIYRNDIFEISRHAHRQGLPVALATNGTLIDGPIAERIGESGIQRVSISIDGRNAASHDGFRGIPGCFDDALRGAGMLKEKGVEFQFNTTITRRNIHELQDIISLAKKAGAVALHLFMLVPVGCGAEIVESEMLDPDEYESVLNSLYDISRQADIEVKATCAPHYYRIIRQRAKEEGRNVTFETHGMSAVTKGCLAGTGVCFISHMGDVQPCGYLPLVAGNVLKQPFPEIWEHAELFQNLRNEDLLKGKCGVCEYRSFCGGCRARAYFDSGDYLDEEPFCSYVPVRLAKKREG